MQSIVLPQQSEDLSKSVIYSMWRERGQRAFCANSISTSWLRHSPVLALRGWCYPPEEHLLPTALCWAAHAWELALLPSEQAPNTASLLTGQTPPLVQSWCRFWPVGPCVLDVINKITWTAEVLWKKRVGMATLWVREGPDSCLDRLLLLFYVHYIEDGPHLLCTGSL